MNITFDHFQRCQTYFSLPYREDRLAIENTIARDLEYLNSHCLSDLFLTWYQTQLEHFLASTLVASQATATGIDISTNCNSYQLIISDLDILHSAFDPLSIDFSALVRSLRYKEQASFDTWVSHISSFYNRLFQDPTNQGLASTARELAAARFPFFSQDQIFDIIRQHISQNTKETISGTYDEPLLDSLLLWINTKCQRFLIQVLYQEEPHSPTLTANIMKSFENHCFEVYVEERIKDIFSIIIEYPDSLPALLDLKVCLLKTTHYPQLVKALSDAFSQRLLHFGASTEDIVTTYVTAAQALSHIDPNLVGLIQQVGGPIRKYLRQRTDTIRCIVQMITESEMDDFSAFPNELEEESFSEEDEETLESWRTWNPKHREGPAPPIDTLGMLVNIYESTDLFCKEYQHILSTRLLSLKDYETASEFRYLELLKLRFGERNFQNCEIMIKDVTDSKRMDTLLHKNNPQLPSFVNPIIASHCFWPKNKLDEQKDTANFTLPESLEKSLAIYTDAFRRLKASRNLQWKKTMGTVDLELTIYGRSGPHLQSFTVSPIHASIIVMFATQPTWNLDVLSKELGLPPPEVQKKLTFWIIHSILCEEVPGVYSILTLETLASNQCTSMEHQETGEGVQ